MPGLPTVISPITWRSSGLGGMVLSQAYQSWVSACLRETICSLSVVVVSMLGVSFLRWLLKAQGAAHAGRPLLPCTGASSPCIIRALLSRIAIDPLQNDVLGVKIPAKGRPVV